METRTNGRKIIVDTYGGRSHGGEPFQEKTIQSRRSAAYYARYAAKNIVASGIAKNVKFKLLMPLEYLSR